MRVKLVKLREEGKRLSPEQIKSAEAIEGELEVVQYRTAPRGYACARILGRMPTGMPVIWATLYEPRLITVDGDICLFDGLEKLHDDRLVLQNWKCLVLGQGSGAA